MELCPDKLVETSTALEAMLRNNEIWKEFIESRKVESHNSSRITADELSANKPITSGLDLFARFVYCQSLLFKAWIDASDMIADKLLKSPTRQYDSKGFTSLLIDVYEETFTKLFRTPDFASNLTKLLKLLTEYTPDTGKSEMTDKTGKVRIPRRRKSTNCSQFITGGRKLDRH